MEEKTTFDPQTFCSKNFLLDAHSDIFWHADETGYDILAHNTERHFDIPRAKQGGLDVMVMAACYSPKHKKVDDPGDYIMHLIKLMDDTATRSNGLFTKLTSKNDIRSFEPDPDKLGYIIAMEGAAPLKGDINNFDKYFNAGMRLLTLTHNISNEVSQGASETEGPFSISGFGWEVIAACEEKGVLIDAAHLHTENMKFILDFLTRPFTVSHTACRALVDDPRNIRDDHLFELGRLGCIVGIDVIQPHIKTQPDHMDATIDDFLDHIEHAVEVAGINSVGIGTDMDIIYPLPSGLIDASSYPAIAGGLNKRGFEDEDIAKIMGGNFRRLFLDILPD